MVKHIFALVALGLATGTGSNVMLQRGADFWVGTQDQDTGLKADQIPMWEPKQRHVKFSSLLPAFPLCGMDKEPEAVLAKCNEAVPDGKAILTGEWVAEGKAARIEQCGERFVMTEANVYKTYKEYIVLDVRKTNGVNSSAEARVKAWDSFWLPLCLENTYVVQNVNTSCVSLTRRDDVHGEERRKITLFCLQAGAHGEDTLERYQEVQCGDRKEDVNQSTSSTNSSLLAGSVSPVPPVTAKMFENVLANVSGSGNVSSNVSDDDYVSDDYYFDFDYEPVGCQARPLTLEMVYTRNGSTAQLIGELSEKRLEKHKVFRHAQKF